MTSVKQQIYDALVAALGTISVQNGFETDIELAAGGGGAQKTLYQQSEIYPYLVVSMPNERPLPREQGAVDHYLSSARFEIICYPEPLDVTDSGSVDDLLNTITADVKNLLLQQNAITPPLAVEGVIDIVLESVDWDPLGAGLAQDAEVTGVIRYTHSGTDVGIP